MNDEKVVGSMTEVAKSLELLMQKQCKIRGKKGEIKQEMNV